ncbi:MAG: polysaccharide biosynthesis/export family protein [Aphanocapsa sp. GSE-SYN-MK-11-07L]|nr:polysaccharide biosynthesis/export family protein [Aphanocapsa sp. GSE-SYN-MK-11-07L]
MAACPPSLAQTAPAASTPATDPAATGSQIQQFDQESYLLGTGDVIFVEVFNQPDISKSYQVLIDGTVSMPLVGNVPVRGLTLKEASNTISAQYANYLKRPVVTARLEASRPVTVGISGAVNRPGTYVVGQTATAIAATGLGQTAPGTVSGAGQGAQGAAAAPKLSLVLQSAGGITANADVRNIQIRRPQAGGAPETMITVNLWRLLRDGDLSQDVVLRDGDSILVPIATALTPAEITELSSATFSPSTINVNVVGEIKAPGVKQLRPNTPLNSAIMAAGGFIPTRANTTKLILIRLNPDGTVAKRELKINLAENLNADNNPPLQNGDTVIIGRSGIASFSDTLGTVLSPLNGITGVFTGGFTNLLLR